MFHILLAVLAGFCAVSLAIPSVLPHHEIKLDEERRHLALASFDIRELHRNRGLEVNDRREQLRQLGLAGIERREGKRKPGLNINGRIEEERNKDLNAYVRRDEEQGLNFRHKDERNIPLDGYRRREEQRERGEDNFERRKGLIDTDRLNEGRSYVYDGYIRREGYRQNDPRELRHDSRYTLVPWYEPVKRLISHAPLHVLAVQRKIVEDVYSPIHTQPIKVIDYRFLRAGGRPYTRGLGGQVLILPPGAKSSNPEGFKSYDELLDHLHQKYISVPEEESYGHRDRYQEEYEPLLPLVEEQERLEKPVYDREYMLRIPRTNEKELASVVKQ